MSFLSKFTVKPWEHAGEMEGLHGEVINARWPGRTGLFMFLAVISSMFLLFIITYHTRSQFPDWEMLTDPRILWLNTAVLILASVAMQMASSTRVDSIPILAIDSPPGQIVWGRCVCGAVGPRDIQRRSVFWGRCGAG